MLRILFIALAFLFNLSAFANPLACARAVPTDNVNFCSSFKSVATCHCTASGLPTEMCKDMGAIYSRMLSVFGSLQRACEYQKATSPQDCVDNWNCYRLGGIDSTGKLCSSTQKSCMA
ncbi:MAG: hypothetical protein WC627_01645 [Legionella sp.]